jgi:hypothetical protein
VFLNKETGNLTEILLAFKLKEFKFPSPLGLWTSSQLFTHPTDAYLPFAQTP